MIDPARNDHNRRSQDVFAHSAFTANPGGEQASVETWRELVSMGMTFGFGLAGLAALVMVLTQ